MSRRDDLIALRDAVQVGPVSAHTASKCFPNGYAHIVNASAYPGAVDAALAFSAAVLPGWRIEEMHKKWSGNWYANLERKSDLAVCTATAETPARALLLATLNALIAESDT